MHEVTLLEMLQKGVHFGHQESRWSPKMKPFIFTSRNGIHIINLEATRDRMKVAAEFAASIAKSGGKILFVGTKRQAKAIIKKYAETCGMPFMVERWVGGALTNFSTIHELIKKLKRLKSEQIAGLLDKYTKKEQLNINKEIVKLQNEIGGMEMLDQVPQAIFIVDSTKERTALREARKMKIPVIAICDTNSNPDIIDFPIPANDDATKSIDFIAGYICEAIQEGKSNQAQTV
ncbi:MAG: 30S ribosomal protein S2 [Patescibacteria group bacterium]|jgi:small subunit ribosomal protein S2